MIIEKRKLSEIKPNENNVRTHTSIQIQEFKKSITKFDVIRPIVVDENGVILAGHGLYEALKQLGYEEADVLVKSGLSEKDKKKLLLADNKIYSLGHDDYNTLDRILKELGQDSDFEIPGYDPDILEELYGIKSVAAAAEEQAKQFEPPTKPQEAFDYQDGTSIPEDSSTRPERAPEPSKKFMEARAEAEKRNFIICPHCGEKIEV